MVYELAMKRWPVPGCPPPAARYAVLDVLVRQLRSTVYCSVKRRMALDRIDIRYRARTPRYGTVRLLTLASYVYT